MYTTTKHGSNGSFIEYFESIEQESQKSDTHTLFSVVKRQKFDSLDVILIATNGLSEAHYNVEENKSIVSDDTEEEYIR